jgi:hypothetical protein
MSEAETRMMDMVGTYEQTGDLFWATFPRGTEGYAQRIVKYAPTCILHEQGVFGEYADGSAIYIGLEQ